MSPQKLQIRGFVQRRNLTFIGFLTGRPLKGSKVEVDGVESSRSGNKRQRRSSETSAETIKRFLQFPSKNSKLEVLCNSEI